jgi:hypothetical protein
MDQMVGIREGEAAPVPLRLKKFAVPGAATQVRK